MIRILKTSILAAAFALAACAPVDYKMHTSGDPLSSDGILPVLFWYQYFHRNLCHVETSTKTIDGNLSDWTEAPVMTDPAGDGGGGANDITSVSMAVDATFLYLEVLTMGTPTGNYTLNLTPPNYSSGDMISITIGAAPGCGAGGSSASSAGGFEAAIPRSGCLSNTGLRGNESSYTTLTSASDSVQSSGFSNGCIIYW